MLGLSEAIISILSGGSVLRKELAPQVKLRRREFSDAQIQHELVVLKKTGVIRSCRKEYHLCEAWVVDLLGGGYQLNLGLLAEDLPKVKTQPGQTQPGAVLQRTWSLSSLTVLERFLRQAILSLLQASTSKKMYAWLPHPWLQLCGRRRELLFQQALRSSYAHMHIVVGGKTMLDRALIHSWPKDILTATSRDSPFEEQRSFHFHVVDDYLLLTQLDKQTAAAIDKLFELRATPEEIPPYQLREVIQAKAAISLTLLRDPIEARKLHARFENFIHRN